MGIEQRIRRRVSALTKVTGSSVTFRRVSRTTGPNPTITKVDTVVTARVTGFPAELINGSAVQATDLQIIVPGEALTIAPTLSDTVVVDGIEKHIISIRPERVGSLVGLWNIQAR